MTNLEKAREICKNIENTLSKMGDKNTVTSQHSIFVPTRISRSILEKKLKQLRTKYKL